MGNQITVSAEPILNDLVLAKGSLNGNEIFAAVITLSQWASKEVIKNLVELSTNRLVLSTEFKKEVHY